MHAPKVCALVCFCTASGQVSILQLLRLPCRANCPLVDILWPLQASLGKISPQQPGFACQLSQLWRHRHRPRGRSEQAKPTSAYRRKPERQRKRRSSKQVEKAELQEELNLRNLPDDGTREVLRKRLNQAIITEQSLPAGKLSPEVIMLSCTKTKHKHRHQLKSLQVTRHCIPQLLVLGWKHRQSLKRRPKCTSNCQQTQIYKLQQVLSRALPIWPWSPVKV